MGTLMITTNQTLNLATYGLKVGDPITVIAVGGGAGGNYGEYVVASSTTVFGGKGGAAGCPGLSGSGLAGGGGAGGGYGAGGGGGGSRTATNYSDTRGGNGGGAGSYTMTTHILNATTVNSVAVTIGAGGVGGYQYQNPSETYFIDIENHAATNGGVTSFGSILSANGGIIDRGGQSWENGGGGGGGAGGYLFPQKIYGGPGGRGGMKLGNYNLSNGSGNLTPLGTRSRETLMGSGGGGGSTSNNQTYELPQESYYGGCGGRAGHSGTYGVESHGSGLVVVMW